jgi:D-xylose transport system substrate-binding protein
MQFGKLSRLTLAGFAGVIAIVATACGGGTASTPSPSPVTVPSDLSISSFDANFTYMPKLKDLVNGGHGLVGVILPETATSARYVSYDLPYLKKAFDSAGYTSSQYKIDNAQGSASTELALAQADITQGATVLVMDPADSTTGSAIQAYAASHGVKLISYDRATFTGTNTYYVSFDNEKVGELIGQGFLDCVTSWGVAAPKVFTLNGGEDIDPNAVSFATGYNKIVWGDSVPQETVGKTNSKGMTLVGDKVAPGWDNAKGGAIFQQQLTANAHINATIEANDGLGNAVIQVLKNKGIQAKKVPTTGQDATLQGMENVLQNYQCGSVYKPIYLEAQDAVALATVLRAGQTPPTALLNGTTTPPSGVSGSQQPASLLVPVWVNSANMAATVIKDQFVDKNALCTAVTTAVCTAAGIS